MTAMLEKPPRSQKRQRPAVAAARLTDNEMNQLRRTADRVGMSVSDLVRAYVTKALLEDDIVIG